MATVTGCTPLARGRADSLVVPDNSAKDLDPALGAFKVILAPAASYEACVAGLAGNYKAVPSNPAYPVCGSGVALSGKVDLGTVFMRRIPRVAFTTQDMAGNNIVGATIGVTEPNGFVLMRADGQGSDPAAMGCGLRVRAATSARSLQVARLMREGR
jgi:hypothetical protein